MSWIEAAPRRLDFCGQPPCPLCYRWTDEGGQPPINGLHKMALDLLQKGWDDLSKDERRDLEGIGRKIHKDGIAALASPPDELPPPPADIGMDSVRQIEGWLSERKRSMPAKPRVLTCDEIAERQGAKEAEQQRKAKERNERLKEAREVAQIFADAQRGQDERPQYEEQRMLRDIDPSFVSYCRDRGIMDPREIYSRWQREYGSRAMSPMMMDPMKGPNRW